MRHNILLFLLLLLHTISFGQTYPVRYIETHTDASFRGLSVPVDNSVWVSGSKGWVGRSTNGGDAWTFKQVPGYEQCDFRTLYAFDSASAIIANAGSPAYILRTQDGGATWKKVYEHNDSALFIDGIGFWNDKRGIIHGDPIAGHMLLLYTKDGGRTWKEGPKKGSPALGEGEASFAASGTAISCFSSRGVMVAVGGRTSKLLVSGNRGKSWGTLNTPMISGKASTGIFSVMRGYGEAHWFVAGGDYRNDTSRTANFFYTLDGGNEWKSPKVTTRGYRECLARITTGDQRQPKNILFAVGPSGIDISTDYGVTWEGLSDEKGFHVIKPTIHNRLILAGSNGKVAIMEIAE